MARENGSSPEEAGAAADRYMEEVPHVLPRYKIYMGYWFFGRPTMEELRQDLRAVTKKWRPDWDITTPELKAAWEEGRNELFYPYGKTHVQTFGEQD